MLRSALPRQTSPCILVLSTLLACGCDEPAKPAGGAGSAAAAATSAAPPTAPTPAPKPTSMPDVIVDPDGPYISGTRINLADPTGPEKLVKVVKDLPIQGNPVTVQADRKAKIPHVAAVVGALGDAGAPKIIIKTDGRNDLPKELKVTPQEKVSSPPSCAIVAMVLKDLSTAIWPLKGGLGKRQRKGLAGPDLSHTGEALEKELAACDSTVAFFSSDESVTWELAFNLAGTVLVSDKKKKIDTLVLLREEPVAGRAVTLGKR
jgi:biopolymer transport protein ExbD